LAAAFTSLGIATMRRYAAWAERQSAYFVSFAAGVLVAASLLHIVPKAIAMTPAAPQGCLAGFLGLYLFNRFLTAHVCGSQANPDAALGVVAMAGIGLHSFVDGVIYSIAFTVSAVTGAVAGAGMILHEFPEGIITYTLLLRSGFADRKAALLALAAAGLSTPLGTLASLPWMGRIPPATLGLLLAFSAGALLYVGATHLLPQAEREPRRYSVAALLGGVATAAALALAH
jgi:ZIP family zinc transporter